MFCRNYMSCAKRRRNSFGSYWLYKHRKSTVAQVLKLTTESCGNNIVLKKYQFNTFLLSLVAGYSLNIGCADVVKIEKNYGLISRYEYLTRVSKGAKNTFLKEFEHWEDDENEILETDIKKCWRLEGENPVAPKTSQGRIAKSLLNKQKVEPKCW